MTWRTKWRMQKSPRELPCCKTPIRVKIVEPGLQSRVCGYHHSTHYFRLEEMRMMPGTLRLRWVTTDEASDYLITQQMDPSMAHGIMMEEL